MAMVRAAADGARRYLARPGIVHLHGSAVRWLWRSWPPTSRPARQARAGRGGVRSLDPHQVKLVEACRRGHAATGDPAFAAAAETVTGLYA